MKTHVTAKKTLVIVGIFILGVLIGNFSPTIAAGVYTRQAAVTKPASVDIDTFWKVWKILDNDFVTTQHRDPSSTDEDRGATTTATSTLSSEERRMYGAIKGMVDAEGDPYTTFLTPSEAKSFETEVKGSFEGVGMELSLIHI